MTLVQDDDVVDHRYNSYIESAGDVAGHKATCGRVERHRAARRGVGLYFQRSREKTIYVLTTVTAIFLPPVVTGLFGMNFKWHAQAQRPRGVLFASVDLPDLHGPGAGARLVVLVRAAAVAQAPRHRGGINAVFIVLV